MTFDALSKELYSLTEGLNDNLAEFSIYLSQQVQILQSEYLAGIQQEHMEEMKHDHFYEGSKAEYWQMLAYKGDGEHLASYSDLLLATWKLERWAEARYPLPPKTAATSGSNMTHSQMPGNLFPLHKLDNHTFATWAMIIWKGQGWRWSR